MMVRAIWSGSISFGLVNVPIKVVTAVQSKDVRFHQLHAEDGARIEQKRFCSAEGREVPYDEVVKGYEISPEKHVIVTKEELETVDPEATHTIDILDFVDLPDIDPIYFEKPYYLMPDKTAGKAYGLLVEAMRRAGRVAIARVVLRTKEHLVVLRPYEDVLTMTTLVYHDELVPPSVLEGVVEAAAQAPSDREIEMAQQLIETLAAPFEPSKYHDTYRERVLALIQQKAEGHAVVAPPPKSEAAKPVDLMSALQASLQNAKKKSTEA